MLSSLQRRAQKLATAMAQLPGVTCPPIDGALYLFPQIALPPKAVAAAAALKKQPDVMCALHFCFGWQRSIDDATPMSDGISRYHF
jgi:alanine transaminase